MTNIECPLDDALLYSEKFKWGYDIRSKPGLSKPEAEAAALIAGKILECTPKELNIVMLAMAETARCLKLEHSDTEPLLYGEALYATGYSKATSDSSELVKPEPPNMAKQSADAPSSDEERGFRQFESRLESLKRIWPRLSRQERTYLTRRESGTALLEVYLGLKPGYIIREEAVKEGPKKNILRRFFDPLFSVQEIDIAKRFLERELLGPHDIIVKSWPRESGNYRFVCSKGLLAAHVDRIRSTLAANPNLASRWKEVAGTITLDSNLSTWLSNFEWDS